MPVGMLLVHQKSVEYASSSLSSSSPSKAEMEISASGEIRGGPQTESLDDYEFYGFILHTLKTMDRLISHLLHVSAATGNVPAIRWLVEVAEADVEAGQDTDGPGQGFGVSC